MVAIVDEIRLLFEQSGNSMYAGEPVTQTEHALQAAELGRQAGAPDPLVAAALLHDIGHLLHDLGEDIAQEGVDDEHERRGAEWLAGCFPPSVSQPVLLHVMAKRYRCAVDPAYLDRLSPASLLSLQLQGGPLDEQQASNYRADPFYDDSLLLRSWDEAAKVPGEETESLEFFLQYVNRVAVGRSENSG